MILDTLTQIQTFQILTLRKAMQLYLTTGLRPNSAYTVANMLRTATKFTNKRYTPRKTSLPLAIDDITAVLEDRGNA